MRRRIITATKILLATALALLIAGAGTLFALAKTAPFLPGQTLFPVQLLAERIQVALVRDATARAERFLDLAERRVQNLEARAGSEYELVALAYLDAALNEALLGISAAPAQAQEALRGQLLRLGGHISMALAQLTVVPAKNPDVFTNAQAKIEAILQAAVKSGEEVDELAQTAGLSLGLPPEVQAEAEPPAAIAPRAVPFPSDIEHTFFSLIHYRTLSG